MARSLMKYSIMLLAVHGHVHIPPTILNLHYPASTNCVHFMEHTNNYPDDPIPDDPIPDDPIPDDLQYGRCKQFGYR
jgi:hypothetical protein